MDMGAAIAGGPLTVAAAGGAIAVGCGVAAVVEGVKWGRRQQTDRKTSDLLET